MSPEGLSLVKQMLQVDPHQRPTIEEIFNHPWMADECAKSKVRANVFNNQTDNAYLSSASESDGDKTNGPRVKRHRAES